MKRINPLYALPTETAYDHMDSPVGTLTFFASSKELHSILWDLEQEGEAYDRICVQFHLDTQHPVIQEAKQQLLEYFSGQRQQFTTSLTMEGTAFQKRAWQALQAIPYGETRSYAQQAAFVGDRRKARAVGMANGLNPIPIIVPCHRVIGSNGKLIGFSGGLERKALLLALESKQANYL